VRHFSHECIPMKGILCMLYVTHIGTGDRPVWLAVSYGMDTCIKGFCGWLHRSKKEHVHVSVSF